MGVLWTLDHPLRFDRIAWFGKTETGRLPSYCSAMQSAPLYALRNTRMTRMVFLLAVSLTFITSAQTARTGGKAKEPPAALEKKLHGMWECERDCVGDLMLRADGTFERLRYSPGNNKLAGTWEMRWNALPPTLVLTCKTSDEPDRFSVGKIFEVKVIQLNDEALAYENPNERGDQPIRFARVKK